MIALFVLLMSACDSLLNVNEDPARISPDQVNIQSLFPSAIRFTASCYFGAAQFGAQYPQYMAGQAISQYTPYGFDQLWRPLYTDALPSLQEIIERGNRLGAFNYSGIAKVMLGLNMLTAAAIYGDLPYTEANQGTSNLYPCYDPMQELYEQHILNLLNGAIEDLQRPLPDLPTLRTVRNDFIYNGDLTKWLRAAYAVRARYYLHMSNRNPAMLQNAVADAQRAFAGNADDLELIFEAQVQNPWFINIGNAVNKTQKPSSFITNLMNGTGRYNGLFDPRLPRYMDNGPEDDFTGRYQGITPGRLIDDEPGVNVNLTANTWHSRNIAPLQMITYPEMQFILAEALLPTDASGAYQAYLRGIRASMQKVGVNEPEINAYVDDPMISMGEGNLTISDIMIQKYIALFLNIESWNDMRRYQYDTNVYPDLQKPVVNQLPGNPWIQRSNVADDEPGVNTCLPQFENQGVVLWLFQ
jgi:hypothetical protein